MKLAKLVRLTFITALCSVSVATFAASSNSHYSTTSSNNTANTGMNINQSGYKVQSSSRKGYYNRTYNGAGYNECDSNCICQKLGICI
jgi:uncharacterized membrane protein